MEFRSSICISFYINYLRVKQLECEDVDSVSDKNVEDLTLLTLRNHKKHKNVQNLSYYDLKWMFPSMEILNCDGLSQFYFGQPNSFDK